MTKIFPYFGLLILFFSNICLASQAAIPLQNIEMSQDPASLKRGALVYYNSCRSCHSLKYIKFQNLQEIGFTDSEINDLRADELKNSPILTSMSPKASHTLFGMLPPDLSIMAKARKHGPQYIYTLMNSFKEKDGIYNNDLFPGIKMPDIFDVSTTRDDASKQIIQNNIKDVTEFLNWSADPRASERKSLGKYVIAYLIVLSFMFYLVMKRVWSRLDN